MAKLILKAPYYKQGHKTEDGRGRGGYAEYIATREGVELLRGGMVNYITHVVNLCGTELKAVRDCVREQILIDCQLEKQSGKPFFTVSHLGGNNRLQRRR